MFAIMHTIRKQLILQSLNQFNIPFGISSLKFMSSHCIFDPRNVLILTKLSRYEYEKCMHKEFTEDKLISHLNSRGSDYQALLQCHKRHKEVETSVFNAFKNSGFNTKLVNRLNYTEENVDWADAIVTTGGDGTYLLAASRIYDRKKPVIGFNSDPLRSKGQLCLPEKYSFDVNSAIKMLKKSQFEWQFRSRIRVTLIGKNIHDPPIELHDQQLMCPENRYLDIDHQLNTTGHPTYIPEASGSDLDIRVLPVLALNEVFVGECVSARVSYLELAFNKQQPFKQKCSGLIVSTGTGSTSWTYNINKLTKQSLQQVLAIAQEKSGLNFNATNPKFVSQVTDTFNEMLYNDPEDRRLVYTIRDQLVPFPSSKVSSAKQLPASDKEFDDEHQSEVQPRGFAERIHIRSRCFDASLVIDGGLSFTFNDGTRAVLESHSEDALRTVVLQE